MNITKLKEKFLKDAPFIIKENDGTGYPGNEIGYIRADHDGYRWHNTCWPVHSELETDRLVAEIDAVYSAFTRSFKDRNDMAKWCRSYARSFGDDEFGAYYSGEYGNYYFRMITRRGDYNLYMHCYTKEEE